MLLFSYLIIVNFLNIFIDMKFHKKHIRAKEWALGVFILAAFTPAWAQSDSESEASGSRLSGFATLGAVYNSNQDVGLVFSGAQTKPAYQGLSAKLDSVVGVQWDYDLLPSTSAKLQAVARAGEEFQPKLRIAYIQQTFNDKVLVRVGRMRSPLFFDADTTEIGYANTMVRGPMPLYAGTTASQIIHIDGLHVQMRAPFDNFLVRLDGYWGGGSFTHYDVTKVPTTDSQINVNGITDMAISVAFGDTLLRYSHARLANYSAGSDQLTQLSKGIQMLGAGLNTSASTFEGYGQTAVAAALRSKANVLAAYDKPFDGRQMYDSVGFSTQWDDLGVAGEWAWLNSEAIMLGQRQAYQFTVNYKLGSFTPYLAYSSARRVSNNAESTPITNTGIASLAQLDAGINAIAMGMDQMATLSNVTMQGLSLGVRWDLARNMAAKMQYDVLNTPNASTPGAFKVRTFPFDNTAHVLSASLDVVF